MTPSLTPSHLALRTHVAVHAAVLATGHRLRTDERGEGVISAAIAILVMAFLGALLWATFKNVLDGAGTKTETQIGKIGQ